MTSIRGARDGRLIPPAATATSGVTITVDAPATAAAAAPAPSFLALVDTMLMEGTIGTEFAIAVLGGTVTYITTRSYEGAQSLRINRTGTTRIDATRASKWGAERVYSGQFWLYAVARPTAEVAIAQIPYGSGSNIELRMDASGNVRTGRQGGASSASASATPVTTGSWFRISWWADTSTGTASIQVAVNDDTPVGQTWAQAAEAPAEWAFGSRLVTTASTYDLDFDLARNWIGTFVRDPMPAAGTTINVDAPATAAAAALAPGILISLTAGPGGAVAASPAPAVRVSLTAATGQATAQAVAPTTPISLTAAPGAATGAAPAPGVAAALTTATAAASGAGVAPSCQLQPHPPAGTASGAGSAAGLVVTLTAATGQATAAANAPGGAFVVSPPTAIAGGAGLSVAAVGVSLGAAPATAAAAALAPTAPASLTAAAGQATGAGPAGTIRATLTAGPATATGAGIAPAAGSRTVTVDAPATASAAGPAPAALVSIPLGVIPGQAAGAGTSGTALVTIMCSAPATAAGAALEPTPTSAGSWTPDTPGQAAGAMLEPTFAAGGIAITVDRGNPPIYEAGFESGVDGYSYAEFPTATADGTVAQSTEQAQTGTGSLKLVAGTTASGFVAAARAVTLTPYRRYVARSSIYVDSIDAGLTAINVLIGGGSGTQSNTSYPRTTGVWQTRTTELTTPANTAGATVTAMRFTGSGSGGNVIAYADDVTLSEVALFAIGVAQPPGILRSSTAEVATAGGAAPSPTVTISIGGQTGTAGGAGQSTGLQVAYRPDQATGAGAMQQPTFSTGADAISITADAPATATAAGLPPGVRVSYTAGPATTAGSGVSPACRISATPGVASATGAGRGPGLSVTLTMAGTGDAAGAAPDPILAVGVIAMQYGTMDTFTPTGIDSHPAGGVDAASAAGVDHYAPQGVDVG